MESKTNRKMAFIETLLKAARKFGILSITFRTIEAIHVGKLRLLNQDFRRPHGADKDGYLVPPYELILSVSGTLDVPWFIKGGKLATQSILDALEKNALDINRFEAILDFGCGCGRVVRHWDLAENIQIHGTDYNSKSIRWCKRNLSFAHFAKNRLTPPMHYDDSKFDFIYALSVFTHMPNPIQSLWIDELYRVLKPNGYLLITTHGEHYIDEFSHEEQEAFQAGNLVVRYEEAAGTNLCCAYHPPQYVRRQLANRFDIVDFIPEGAKGNPHQDLFLLRRSEKTNNRTGRFSNGNDNEITRE